MAQSDDVFRFLTENVRNAVLQRFESCPLIALSDALPPNISGVYAIYHHGVLLYIGKAMKSVRQRLSEHRRTLERFGYDSSQFKCRWVAIGDDNAWIVLGAEQFLIGHFGIPVLNTSGFGNHTPGSGRPGTRRSHWEQSHAQIIAEALARAGIQPEEP